MIPHFNYPFDFGLNYHAEVVEQDSLEDVVSCVSVAFLTEPGFRAEAPTFGIPDQVFEMQPLDLESLIDSVQEWESRADMVLDQLTSPDDELAMKLTATITARRAGG